MARSTTLLLWLALVALPSVAAEAAIVRDDTVSVSWQPAQGPVVQYGVWVLRDGGPRGAQPEFFVTQTSVDIDGQPGESVRLQVAPYDGTGARGPFSPESEEFVFVTPDPVLPYDFDGDGRSDLLWRNASDGSVEIWLMDEFGPFEREQLAGIADPSWQLRGSSDFDGDARADLLWTNGSTGETIVWLMDGTLPKQSVPLNAAGGGFEATPIGDVQMAGETRLVMRDAGTGSSWLWQLELTDIVFEDDLARVAMPLVATCDLDGDGFGDLFHHKLGNKRARVWMSRGGSVPQHFFVHMPDPWLRFIGCGDFDGVGRNGLVWLDGETGKSLLWTADGVERWSPRRISRGGHRPLEGDATWQADGVGDFDGDGRSDLLMRAADGRTSVVLMDGVIASLPVAVDAPLGPDWDLVAR